MNILEAKTEKPIKVMELVRIAQAQWLFKDSGEFGIIFEIEGAEQFVDELMLRHGSPAPNRILVDTAISPDTGSAILVRTEAGHAIKQPFGFDEIEGMKSALVGVIVGHWRE